MIEIETINEISSYFVGIITIGIVARMLIYCIQIAINIDEKEGYIKKIKNLLIALAIVVSLESIKLLVETISR